MLVLKHLKTLQHVSIIIQIIFRELVDSLLKTLNLNFFKKCKSSTVVMWHQNVWCVRVRGHASTRTKYYAAASPQLAFYNFKFLNSVTLKRNLRTPWRWSE